MGSVSNIVTDVLSLLFVLIVFGFVGYRLLKKSEDPGRLLFKWALSGLILAYGSYRLAHADPRFIVAIALIMGMALACVWVNSISHAFANPFAAMFDGGRAEIEAKPIYSYAETFRKRGHPREAIAAAREQLAKFPDDFAGVLLIATIQAEDLKNLPVAEATMEEFIARPGQPPPAVFAALQNLADLQWRHGHGAAAAIATLERVTQLYPDSPLAHAALQRIAHLDAADATKRHRFETRYAVPLGERAVGLRPEVKIVPKEGGPAEEMERLVSQLEKHPADVESREKLAMLYADAAARPDLAVDQLEQLISLRVESARHVSRWLNLLATVHAHFANDVPAAEEALRRIIDRFPNTAMANEAVTRLASIALEAKGNQQTAAKTLGAYEKQIGLKKSYGPADPTPV